MIVSRRILFLYSRQSGYLTACLNQLGKLGHKVLLICWQSSEEAPFTFKKKKFFEKRLKNSFTNKELRARCVDFKPDLLFIAGWLDKDYIKITTYLKARGVKVVMGVDNPWKNTLRQNVGLFVLKSYLKKATDIIWGAGREQMVYAKKLGFGEGQSMSGLYCADTDEFEKINSTYDKILLYAGRLLKWKGVLELMNAFTVLSEEERNGWKLYVAGTGELNEHIHKYESESVKYLGFLQPDELIEEMGRAGAFILPSHDEHWGVIVHEAATAGLPLLLSKKVRASELFLRENENGYFFEEKCELELTKKLVELFKKEKKDIISMGRYSKAIGLKYTPREWAFKLLSALKK